MPEDKDEPTLMDNVDPRLEPEDARNLERAPPGSVGMRPPASPGQSPNQPEVQFAGLITDHQRQQEKIEQQRASRASGRSNAEREAEHSSLQTAKKSPFLGNEFKDAKPSLENNPHDSQRDDLSGDQNDRGR